MHEGTATSRILAPFQHPWGWTAAAPVACAVHCALMPIAAFAAPSVVTGGGVEWGLLTVTLLVSVYALTLGAKTHGSLVPLAPVGLGLTIWVASLLFSDRVPAAEFTTMAASILVASGLLWNSRLSCISRESCCSACQDVLDPAESEEITVAAETPVWPHQLS